VRCFSKVRCATSSCIAMRWEVMFEELLGYMLSCSACSVVTGDAAVRAQQPSLQHCAADVECCCLLYSKKSCAVLPSNAGSITGEHSAAVYTAKSTAALHVCSKETGRTQHAELRCVASQAERMRRSVLTCHDGDPQSCSDAANTLVTQPASKLHTSSQQAAAAAAATLAIALERLCCQKGCGAGHSSCTDAQVMG
jgi:hypothetical protein